tara:strand:+ start:1592 stop:2437 length:846 start_codon:yes stop_codon:yes gene_type:complete
MAQPQNSEVPSVKVRGYMKPSSSFHTLKEWKEIVTSLLDLQKSGIDTRGNPQSLTSELSEIVEKYFGYQLNDEVARWELLTRKNVLDFIEDFVNHRFWSFENEFGNYFPDISQLRFAYFYSRGDMEPYVMLDDAYTVQMYGSTHNPKALQHYTSESGLARLKDSIDSGNGFDISAFTVAERPFFRPESNLIVYLVGNVKAGFRSDIKSMALDNGLRACNMYRLGYPGEGNNICYELDSCDGTIKTSLWNEYIVRPSDIIKVETAQQPVNENIREFIRHILS